MGLSLYPNSSNIDLIQTSCLEQSDAAMYSASVDDRAINFCAHDCQLNVPFANFKKYPVCEHLLFGSDAQSESVHAVNVRVCIWRVMAREANGVLWISLFFSLLLFYFSLPYNSHPALYFSSIFLPFFLIFLALKTA